MLYVIGYQEYRYEEPSYSAPMTLREIARKLMHYTTNIDKDCFIVPAEREEINPYELLALVANDQPLPDGS